MNIYSQTAYIVAFHIVGFGKLLRVIKKRNAKSLTMFRSLNRKLFCLLMFFFVNVSFILVFIEWKDTGEPQERESSAPMKEFHKQIDNQGKIKRKAKCKNRKTTRQFILEISFQEKKLAEHRRDMAKLHKKVYDYTSDDEIADMFKEVKLSSARYNKIIDIQSDHKLLQSLLVDQNKFHNRLTDQLNLKLRTNWNKTILIWSDEEQTWANDFQEKSCNVNNCLFTYDKSSWNTSNAILFTDVAITKQLPKFLKSQVKIFYRIESPFNSNFIVDNNALHMNWSATYRRDSMIPTPYEYFKPFHNVLRLPSTPIKNFSNGKYKIAAWFASNCYTHNGRANYVMKLREYIDVDVYGHCGEFHCERGRTECDTLLKNEYKFYLAFENGNCKDYVTEKLFWNALRNDIVPVVMGAHPEEYKRIAPPRSYIHVDMFDSPKQLADYLIYLNEHDDLYNSYFLWKNAGEFIDTKFACRLCAMVNIAEYFPMWYENANEWWRVGCDRFLNLDGYSSWSEASHQHSESNETAVMKGWTDTSIVGNN